MYTHILAALDGSRCSNYALLSTALLADNLPVVHLVGCHVYASKMHRQRFEEMEPGLPGKYQAEEKLDYLRGTHDKIINEGMQLISDAYISPLVEIINNKEIKVTALTPEGKNYVEFNKALENLEPQLILMGAHGQGELSDDDLGGFAERILINLKNHDLLLIREMLNFKNHPIVVGVDGSDESYSAFMVAAELARIFKTQIKTVAVYDPFFHTKVFQNIAAILPEASASKFDFTAQEQLHDEIIDEGLEQLYAEGLRKCRLIAEKDQLDFTCEVIKGKVYSGLKHYAALHQAGLIIIGFNGLHKNNDDIGSNTLKLARKSKNNILIVHQEKQLDLPELEEVQIKNQLEWTPDALTLMEKVPVFAQKMAKKYIEKKAMENNILVITKDFIVQQTEKMPFMKKAD